MSEQASEQIAIVGAGIGGLTTARALRLAGLNVRVFERAGQLRAVGSGITVQANAMQALDAIASVDSIAEIGYRFQEVVLATSTGDILDRLNLRDVSERIGYYGVTIHRSRLIETLAEPVADAIEFHRTVQWVRNDDGGAVVKFDNGQSQRFRAVVGCDGLHSAVRRSLRGEEPLRYAGYTTWRGLSTMETDGLVAGEYWGGGRRFGLTLLGDREVYWFAVDDAPEGEEPTEPIIDEIRLLYDDWVDVVHRILDAADPDSIIRTDSHDRPPVHDWGRGAITLLGDAAHPMTPNLGQGGSQAIEDAVVLGRTLEGSDTVEEGFRRYEDLRRDRANRFVEQSWKMGRVAHWKNPVARGVRNLAMRLLPASMTERRMARMYDFEGWYESVA